MYPIYEEAQNRVVCGKTNFLAPAKHLQKQIELVLVLEGEAEGYIDNRCYPLRSGDAFLVFPNQVHYYASVENAVSAVLIIMEPDFCPDFRNVFRNSVLEHPIASDVLTPVLRTLCDTMTIPANRRNPHYRAELRGFFSLLLARFFTCNPPRPRARIDTDSLQNILSYCSQNYASDLSLDSLAQALHISKFHISHLLNGKLHMTFCDYLNSIRIAAAIPLLESGAMTVTELSHQVGYNSTRTFNRAFLRQVGMTPRAYRLQLEEKRLSASRSDTHF